MLIYLAYMVYFYQYLQISRFKFFWKIVILMSDRIMHQNINIKIFISYFGDNAVKTATNSIFNLITKKRKREK